MRIRENLDWIFSVECGVRAVPRDWCMVVLDGWWMKETVVPGTRLVVVDSCFAFSPREMIGVPNEG